MLTETPDDVNQDDARYSNSAKPTPLGPSTQAPAGQDVVYEPVQFAETSLAQDKGTGPVYTSLSVASRDRNDSVYMDVSSKKM